MKKAENSPWAWNEPVSDFLKSNDNEEMCFAASKDCDASWSNKTDPTRHSHLPSSCTSKNNNAIHATIEQEEALNPSMLDPTNVLIAKDELSSWRNELWINDRGHDASAGELAHGNSLSMR